MHSDHNSAWNSCLLKIKDDIGDQGFETWFKPIKPVRLENKILTIQVPSQFFYEYLEEHYVNLIDDHNGSWFMLKPKYRNNT